MIIYLSQHPDNRETGTAIWQLFKSSSSKLQSKRDRFLFPTSGISQPSPLSCNYNRRNISDTQVNGMAHQASPNCSSLQDSWSKWELWNWVPRDALPPVSLYIITSTLQTKLNIDHCLQGTLQDLIDGAHWNWHPQIRHCTSLYITHKTLLPDLAGKTNATSLFQKMNMQVIHKTKSTPPPPLNPVSMSSPPSPLCSHPTPPFWSPAFASADSTNRPLASEALCQNISGGHTLNLTPPSGQNPLVKRTTSVDQSCLSSCRSFPYSQNVRTFWFGNL